MRLRAKTISWQSAAMKRSAMARAVLTTDWRMPSSALTTGGL